MRKRKYYGKNNYKCTIRKRIKDKYGVYKDTFSTSKSAVTFIVGDYILVDLYYKIYDRIFSEMKRDELIYFFGSEEVIELLTEKVDSSNIRGKIVVALGETEAVFRREFFNQIYNIIQAEKVQDKESLNQEDINYNNLDFEIPNQFDHLDLTKKLH